MESSFSISKNFLSKEGKDSESLIWNSFFNLWNVLRVQQNPQLILIILLGFFPAFRKSIVCSRGGGIVKTDAFAHANLR